MVRGTFLCTFRWAARAGAHLIEWDPLGRLAAGKALGNCYVASREGFLMCSEHEFYHANAHAHAHTYAHTHAHTHTCIYGTQYIYLRMNICLPVCMYAYIHITFLSCIYHLL